MKLFTFIKSFHNTHMIIISLLILIALLYFNKTHFKENIQNIDNLPNNSQQSSISLASTGVNNVVDLMNSTKQKNVTNVDYNNRIEQKEINYELLMSAYLTFNTDKILETDIQITKSLVSNSVWKKMEYYFLTKRNKFFGERVKELIIGNRVFIAVGASHLGGETGLLKQFKDAGFKLKPIKGLN